MKFKHLFVDAVYDSERVDTCPLVITWAEAGMAVEAGSKYLAISAKTYYYVDSFKVTEEFFEDALQAYFIFPDDPHDDDDESNNLRLEFVKALLNK